MNCPRCNKENDADSRFCIFCGSPLINTLVSEEEAKEGLDAGSGSGSVEDQLQELRQVVGYLAGRVAVLETGGARPGREGSVAAAGVSGVTPTARPTAPPPSPPEGGLSINWERVLGMNWFAIVGAVALTIGVGFFLRLAFENNWIGVTGRIILGIVVGMAFLGVGEYVGRRYPLWAHAVTGGGISILYLSIYAAFGFYQLIDPIPALMFLALVVVTSGLLAIKYESRVIALLGIAGAFLTPILLGGDLEPGQRYLLLVYILLVDAGILGISTFRNWRWFTLVGLLTSYALLGAWFGQDPPSDLVLAELGLTAMFLIFVGATSLFHIVWRIAPKPSDMMLVSLNAIAYFGETYILLWKDYQQWFGFIALSVSLFYGLVGYSTIRRSGAPPQVAFFALATALVFLTLAMPLQLSGSWVTVAWAAEGVVLMLVGFYLGNWQTRAFGLGVLAIAVFRLLVFDTFVDTRTFDLLLNERFPIFVVTIASIYVAAYLYRRNKGRLEEWEKNVGLFLASSANLLTLWVLSAEVIEFFEKRRIEALDQGLSTQASLNAKTLGLTALWAIYAGGLLAVALAKRSRFLRWAGFGLLSIPALKLLLIDTFAINIFPQTHLLLVNFYFLTFLVVLAVVLFAYYLYRRQRSDLEEEERNVFIALLITANVLSLWVFSAEAFHFFDSLEIRRGTDLENAKHLSLTLLWAVYAVGVIAAGMWRGSSIIRLAGIVLMGVPVVKLFGFDVFLLERGFRVAAFVTLGVLLLATGLVYQRYSTSVKGFLLGKAS